VRRRIRNHRHELPRKKIERQISIQTAVGWRNNDRLRQDFFVFCFCFISTNRRSTGCAAATATSLGLREQSGCQENKNKLNLSFFFKGGKSSQIR
jgi:hypothetical protein